MYEFNNERYIKNGIRLHNSNHDYTIKTQGEELIDVLEAGDIARDTITNTTLVIKEFDGKFVIFNDDTCTSFIDIVNFKILTHEQYLPLAQEEL